MGGSGGKWKVGTTTRLRVVCDSTATCLLLPPPTLAAAVVVGMEPWSLLNEIEGVDIRQAGRQEVSE